MSVTLSTSALLSVLVLANPMELRANATLAQHSGWVGGVAFSPNGDLLATAGTDEMKIWDPISRSTFKNVDYLGNYVSSVAFSPDSKSLAVGCWDNSVRVWDVSTVKAGQYMPKHQKFLGHKGAVLSVAFTPDGKQLASGSIDSTIKFWDFVTGRAVATLNKHRSWVNSLSFARDGRLASGSSDNSALVWRRNGDGWQVESAHRVPEGEIRCVALSPSGKVLAAGTRYGTVRVWDLAAGKELAVLKGHPGDVWALTFSPDGRFLASGAGDWDRPGVVHLWNAATWQQAATLKHSGEVLCVAFAPDGRTLAAGSWDQTVKLWDVSTVTQARR